MQLFFEPAGDVRKHLGFVRLHQQLVAGAGVEFRLNVRSEEHTSELQSHA